jgi:hypothetical protein
VIRGTLSETRRPALLSLGGECTARCHPIGDPGVDFLFNPPNGVRGDSDPHREQAFLLQFVELGFLDSSPIDDLWKPK